MPSTAPTSATPITFVVPGQQPGTRATRGAAVSRRTGQPLPGQVKESVRLAHGAPAASPVRVTAVPGEDVVVLHIAGGPALMLHPETARDLMLGQGSAQRGATRAPASATWPCRCSCAGARWSRPRPRAARGFLGDVLLSAFEVSPASPRTTRPTLPPARWCRRSTGRSRPVSMRCGPESLEALKGSGRLKLQQVPPASRAECWCWCTAPSSTPSAPSASSGQLHPQRVRELFTHYGGRVYALDHPTLGASPIANALTLVQTLPTARGCTWPRIRAAAWWPRCWRAWPRSPTSARRDWRFCRRRLRHAAAGTAGPGREVRLRQGIVVERVVRVACPARGTLLASKRLDAYLSVLKWTLDLAGVPVLPELLDFLAEVARRRADPRRSPAWRP
jgi:hypothetical protein